VKEHSLAPLDTCCVCPAAAGMGGSPTAGPSAEHQELPSLLFPEGNSGRLIFILGGV